MANSQSSVLVLDADEATRTLYERALADRWRMLGSASEDEALVLLEGQPIDALVVEPATLEDDGWDFLARIRRARPKLPIVVCSTLDARRKGVRQGVTAYLIKPVSPQQLADVLREVLTVVPSTENSAR